MANISQRGASDLSRGLRRLFLVLPALLAAVVQARAADIPTDLSGTWHVLIHYTDENATDSEAVRWDDKVWVFERKGSRLRWIEYPMVIFADKSGRFERLGTNRASRIVTAWEPNEKQRAQIERGLEVNPRGKKEKSLRKVDEEWRSQSRSRAASASVISYTEHWSIEGNPERPVFRREDQMGSGRSETFEGVTLYATAETGPDGSLVGTFQRDETRHGTFRMVRAGPVGDVRGSGKDQNERVRDVMMESFQREMRHDSPQLRVEVRAALKREMRKEGIDPAQHERAIDGMIDRIVDAIVKEGRSPGEIEQMIRSGEIDLGNEVLRGQVRSAVEKDLSTRGVDPADHAAEVERATDRIVQEIEAGRSPEEIEAMIQEGGLGL